ncbi:hypothetical protein MMAS_47980 [Mycobacteroides abscessus subsp. massiliense CCUG 48898 = JCM 15300]|uniref:Uncharacterized protein n=1 Tax=Mycobacteroides abscessus MAB_091912_2446 TaxID=1335414 RepID=A0A829M4P9_9MYCO|nr:hypothetical protein MMAS_47980 [Mycobacteroides abscessus subsp. massiliense CCUG 48898 = JCM 15300]ESV61174.1 hypothetical protein L833_3559 [Mycobacteroides abscessus MAB_091912_2446]
MVKVVLIKIRWWRQGLPHLGLGILLRRCRRTPINLGDGFASGRLNIHHTTICDTTNQVELTL